MPLHVRFVSLRHLRGYQGRAGRALRVRDDGLATLATAYEYADQGHLSRDYRRLAGVSPGGCAMEDTVDEIEWVTPGNSAVGGSVRGKQALAEHWAKFAEKGFSSNPQYWFADGDRVVVCVQASYPGEADTDSADVLTFNADGKLVKFQSASDTALLGRVFGAK
jgi:hypothetical protein